jgi:NAD(P)-dependent dehydrogenase (short-subunit alcohol dehydrogenase family)
MSKTIVVCGYGPGISTAVAERFGAEGFQVALVARRADKLAAGVAALEAKGVRAAAFPANLADPDSVRAVIGKVQETLGPITVLQWTAYDGGAGDLLTADEAAVRGVLDIAVTSLLAAVKAALPDLRREKDAAVLVTNGGLGMFDSSMDAAAAGGAMGLGVANAAKHKLVGVLAQKLKPENVFVGEVMVFGLVKGTAFDGGRATIDASTIAEKFWDLYRSRTDVYARVT